MVAVQSLNNPFRDIFEQYVDEVSFLWILRRVAIDQPHYLVSDVIELEERLVNNLKGLFTSPEIVWDICEEALQIQEPGEIFCAAVIAFRSLETDKIQIAVETGLANDETVEGLVSALGWLPKNIAEPWLERFIKSKDLSHKYLAIAAHSVSRSDPKEILDLILEREDCVAHEQLYARSLRLVGELKRLDLAPMLKHALEDERPTIQFWSLWSSIMLGNRSLVPELATYFDDPDNKEHALQLFFRTAPVELARQHISTFAKAPETLRIAIRCAGMLGDPQVVPWLINLMEQPLLARVAGESFTTITGIHLDENSLAIELPNMEHLVPSDNPDDIDVSMDDDENLPWPDYEKLKVLWQTYGKNYQAGKRYFLGKTITPQHLDAIFQHGYQRHRIAAAFELALCAPSSPYLNHKERLYRE